MRTPIQRLSPASDRGRRTAPRKRSQSGGWQALALLGALVVLASGCSEVSRERIRSWTYPPDFNYLSAAELRSTMAQIAVEIAALNALLSTAMTTDEVTRERVVQHLETLDAAAQRLGPGGWPSNHPRISENVGRFQRNTAAALRAARHDPPQYFLAGSLAGSCSLCHDAS